jgi:hypothetical protein
VGWKVEAIAKEGVIAKKGVIAVREKSMEIDRVSNRTGREGGDMNGSWRIGDRESQSVVSRDRIRIRVRVRDGFSRVRHGTSTCAADGPRAVRMLPLTTGTARTYLTK